MGEGFVSVWVCVSVYYDKLFCNSYFKLVETQQISAWSDNVVRVKNKTFKSFA